VISRAFGECSAEGRKSSLTELCRREVMSISEGNWAYTLRLLRSKRVLFGKSVIFH
jgi:hypothetical protein